MPSNLAIDDTLLETALKISGLKTKKETINAALAEFINRRKSAEVISMFGKVEYDEDYNYKQARQRKV